MNHAGVIDNVTFHLDREVGLVKVDRSSNPAITKRGRVNLTDKSEVHEIIIRPDIKAYGRVYGPSEISITFKNHPEYGELIFGKPNSTNDVYVLYGFKDPQTQNVWVNFNGARYDVARGADVKLYVRQKSRQMIKRSTNRLR